MQVLSSYEVVTGILYEKLRGYRVCERVVKEVVKASWTIQSAGICPITIYCSYRKFYGYEDVFAKDSRNEHMFAIAIKQRRCWPFPQAMLHLQICDKGKLVFGSLVESVSSILEGTQTHKVPKICKRQQKFVH